ncbi:MAG TPA: hypothetical protein VGB07_36340 [Blastocatellia bacterium]
MPINPELKHLYPPDWKAISRRIRFERAGGKCERCGAPNRHWRRSDADGLFFQTAEDAALFAVNIHEDDAVISRIILTTAHLNHDPTDNREENLAALCQRCHLAHDLKHHLESRRINREKVTGQQRLFERR